MLGGSGGGCGGGRSGDGGSDGCGDGCSRDLIADFGRFRRFFLNINGYTDIWTDRRTCGQ